MCPCRSIQMGRWPAEPEGSDAVMWQNGLKGTRGLGPGAPASPRRARSAPACGVSRGPRASAPRFKAPRVRVPCMNIVAIIAMPVKRNGRLTRSKGPRHRAAQRRLSVTPPPAMRRRRQRATLTVRWRRDRPRRHFTNQSIIKDTFSISFDVASCYDMA
jgi:hypothetical protein